MRHVEHKDNKKKIFTALLLLLLVLAMTGVGFSLRGDGDSHAADSRVWQNESDTKAKPESQPVSADSENPMQENTPVTTEKQVSEDNKEAAPWGEEEETVFDFEEIQIIENKVPLAALPTLSAGKTQQNAKEERESEDQVEMEENEIPLASAPQVENTTSNIGPNQVITPEPTPNVTPEPEPSPDVTPEPQPTPDVTPEPEPSPDVTPEPEPSPDVTLEPEPSPDVTPEPEPTPDVTPGPEPTPDVTPEPEPTPDVTPEPDIYANNTERAMAVAQAIADEFNQLTTDDERKAYLGITNNNLSNDSFLPLIAAKAREMFPEAELSEDGLFTLEQDVVDMGLLMSGKTQYIQIYFRNIDKAVTPFLYTTDSGKVKQWASRLRYADGEWYEYQVCNPYSHKQETSSVAGYARMSVEEIIETVVNDSKNWWPLGKEKPEYTVENVIIWLEEQIYNEQSEAYRFLQVVQNGARGVSLNSTGRNYAPAVNEALREYFGLSESDTFAWRIWNGGAEGFNIFFAPDTSFADQGELVADAVRYNTNTTEMVFGYMFTTFDNDGNIVLDGSSFTEGVYIPEELLALLAEEAENAELSQEIESETAEEVPAADEENKADSTEEEPAIPNEEETPEEEEVSEDENSGEELGEAEASDEQQQEAAEAVTEDIEE